MLRFEVGVLLTAVALASMLYWSFHELRRVDRVIARYETSEEESQEDSQ